MAPVPTIDGKVSVKVPKGSNTGSILRLKGRGIVNRQTQKRGEQYVRIVVMLPERIDDELAEFLDRWGKTHPYEVRGRIGGR